MEATTNTPKRTRTVRASHPANAFRQEPPGLARSTFGFLDDDDIGWLKARVEDVLADYGSRYLSKVFDDEWLRENGFLEQTWADFRAADIQAAKHAHDIIAARPTAPVTAPV